MPRSLAPPQLRSLLRSMTLVTTKYYVTARGLGHHLHHLRPCWSTGNTLLLGPCRYEKPTLLPQAIVTSELKLHTADHIWAYGPATVGACVDVHCLCKHREPHKPCVEPCVEASPHLGKLTPDLTKGVGDLAPLLTQGVVVLTA